MKNIYDILSKIDFEKHCEQYALGFQRDTDTPTMTKFRQESMKEFCFDLIQKFYEIVLQDYWQDITAVRGADTDELAYKKELNRTRKALDLAKERLKNTILDAEILATPEYLVSRAKETLDEITALEQKDVK